MKKENIKQLTGDFESFVNNMDNWIEFWFARDLQHLLWYTEWRNFWNILSKAKTALETSGEDIINHFVDVNKMVDLWSGSRREIDDIMLTRNACYLIAMNGDTSKEEIAFAQQYFVSQTRNFEMIQKRILETERLYARKKLSETEKELSQTICKQTKSDVNFWLIRSKWDKPLADFMPTILLKAKDFATEITIFNAKDKHMQTEREISGEHITNNRTIRKTLIERGIIPENISPEEDLKKIERKLASEKKKGLQAKNWFTE